MAPLIRVDGGKPVGKIGNGDSLFFCCRRGDRETQLTEAFADPGFGSLRSGAHARSGVVPLVQFHEKVRRPTHHLSGSSSCRDYGRGSSLAGVAQTRIAESEKAAHVTFFFNGRRVAPYSNEQWVTVPSPHSSEFLSKPATSTMEVALEVERAMAASPHEAEARAGTSYLST
jgi:2,3-bisphosphoglycerate-independent phosphoglycerate mutase